MFLIESKRVFWIDLVLVWDLQLKNYIIREQGRACENYNLSKKSRSQGEEQNEQWIGNLLLQMGTEQHIGFENIITEVSEVTFMA